MNKKLLIYLFLILLTLGFLLFNKYGLVNFLELKSDVKALDDSINQRKIELKLLKDKIDSLKTSKIMIEKVAREKYHMKRKNEKVIIVEE